MRWWEYVVLFLMIPLSAIGLGVWWSIVAMTYQWFVH